MRGHAAIAPLTVALPLLTAALVAALRPVLPRRLVDTLAPIVSAAVAAGCCALLLGSEGRVIVDWLGGWTPHGGVALGITFAVDPLGAGVAALAAALTTAALVFSWRYFDAVGTLYHVLMLLFLAGMTGFALTGDLFDMFVFFELMGVAAYALTGFKVDEPGPLQGGLNFALINSVGAFLMLIGIGLVYARTGALNMAEIGAALGGRRLDPLVLVAFTLIASGLMVKAAIVPFHFWLADAHAVAPSPVCVLFSGVMVELGLYGVARVYWSLFAGAFGPLAGDLRAVLVGLGVATALVGGVMCFAQRHLKRLLAFSTVSHAGLVLLGIALLSPLGLAGAALYVLAHGLVKGALFLGVGVLLDRFANVDEMDLAGRGRLIPSVTATLIAGGLLLAGLPFVGLFPGKVLLEASARDQGYGWVASVFVVGEALTGGAVLRAGGRLLLPSRATVRADDSSRESARQAAEREEPETSTRLARTPVVMAAPMLALLILGVALCLPGRVTRDGVAGAARMEDQRAYAAAVLGGPASTRLPGSARPALPPVEPSDVVDGAVSAILALALAAAGLFGGRAPAAARVVFESAIGRPVAELRRIHSGLAGDYVAWLMVGVAVFGWSLAATTLFR